MPRWSSFLIIWVVWVTFYGWNLASKIVKSIWMATAHFILCNYWQNINDYMVPRNMHARLVVWECLGKWDYCLHGRCSGKALISYMSMFDEDEMCPEAWANTEPSGHPVNRKDSQSHTVVIHLSVCIHASCCLILEAVMANWGTWSQLFKDTNRSLMGLPEW